MDPSAANSPLQSTAEVWPAGLSSRRRSPAAAGGDAAGMAARDGEMQATWYDRWSCCGPTPPESTTENGTPR